MYILIARILPRPRTIRFLGPAGVWYYSQLLTWLCRRARPTSPQLIARVTACEMDIKENLMRR
jgi:hypothetical protein